MKKKFLTLLMSIFMIIPLAGCGEENMDREPTESEVKLVTGFAEQKSTGGFETNASSLQLYYPDCADVTGNGFYNVGETATISIDYDDKVCNFAGWVVDGEIRGRSPSISYRIDRGNRTVNVYAVMAKNNQAIELNTTSTYISFGGLSVKTYDYDENDVVDLVDGTFTVSHKLNPNDETPTTYVYEYDSEEGTYGALKYESKVYKILSDNVVYLEDGAPYSLVYKDSVLVGITAGRKQENIKTLTTTEDLQAYKLPNTIDQTFATLVDKIVNPTNPHPQGIKLASLLSTANTNLSYYAMTDANTTSDKLQSYKITWKYVRGACGIPNIEFDPNVDELPKEPYLCINASIDLTTGITKEFTRNAVKSTLYNQAYVTTDKTEACYSATLGNENITATCSFIRNIGALTLPESDKNEQEKKLFLDDPKIAYYALTTDSLGDTRVEAVDTSLDVMKYRSFSNSTTPYVYTTDYIKENIASYNLKITPLYNALLNLITNPEQAIGKVEYGYSTNTKSVVIKSIRVDTTTYYFNYVASAGIGAYYNPTIANSAINIIGRTVQAGTPYTLVMEDPAETNADKTVISTLKTLLLANPENFLSVKNAGADIVSKLTTLLHTLANTKEEYKALKKYEFKISADSSNKTITIVYESRLLSLATDFTYQYAKGTANGSTTLYPLVYTASGFNTTGLTGNYAKILNTLNLLMSDTTLQNSAYSITISSSEDYVQYAIAYTDSDTNTTTTTKIRYYSELGKVELLHNETDKIVEYTLELFNPTAHDILKGSFDRVIGGGKSAIKNDAISGLVPLALDAFQIGGDTYYIDLAARKVLNSTGTQVATLEENVKTEFALRFVLSGVNYGLFELDLNSDDTTYELHSMDNNYDKVAKIDLLPAKFLTIDGRYYLIENDGTSDFITFNGTKVILTDTDESEDGVSYSLVISGLVVKNGQDIVSNYESLDVYAVYSMMNGTSVLIDQISSGYIVRHTTGDSVTIYEFTYDETNDYYKLTYNNVEYTITYTPAE